MRNDDNLHQELRRKVGSAREFKCITGCERQAYDWANQHTDTGPSHAPMCRSCHRKLDFSTGTPRPKGRDLSTEEARAMNALATHRGRPLTNSEAVALGRAGGTARSKRMKEDHVMREKMAEVARKNVPRTKRRCTDCGMEALPAHLGNHLKHSGHSGWELL